MKNKYLIKNCDSSYYNIDDKLVCAAFKKPEPYFCEDCTDCVLKQIYEMCKEDLKPVREWQEGDTIFVEYKKDVHLANDILQLLDIQDGE